jgi:RHS repeat-associated protein
LNDSTHPPVLAQNMTYTPCGALSSLTNGCAGSGCTNIQETYFYNKRMQMAVAELGTATTHSADSCRVYNYYVGVANASACSESPSNWPQGSNNNGDLGGYYYHDNVNSGLDHAATYGYDGVDRLHTAAATGSIAYSQTFAYDAYGNMTCTASPAEVDCLAPTYSATTNQITTSGYTYDASGDVTGDGTNTYQWDAEARLTKAVNGAGTAISTNTYNALGQRVRDVNSINTTDEGYGAGGALLRRFTNNSTDPNERSFVPFQGRILAEYYGGSPIGTIFDHPDEIGTLATASLYDGNTLQERLYYPFGEFWTGAGSLGVHQTFAQLPDYDPETDQYNTLARHYTPSGHWMSPDPGGQDAADPSDPQTWNMYAYVRNDPTPLTDPTGLGESGGCTLNGATVPCSLAYGAISSGSADVCPNNFCSGFARVGNGQFAFVQFAAAAGLGGSGYNMLTQPFYPGLTPQQKLDALNAQLAATIDALEAKGAKGTEITDFIKAASKAYNKNGGLTLEGGNFHFPSEDANGISIFSSFSCGSTKRCDVGSLGTLDFSHNDGTLHLDTADPFNFPVGAFTHGLVDVFLGYYWYEVIPRPWSF